MSCQLEHGRMARCLVLRTCIQGSVFPRSMHVYKEHGRVKHMTSYTAAILLDVCPSGFEYAKCR